MIPKLTVLCFALSYAATLLFEITRLFFRSGLRGAIMLGFAGLGLVLHALFLIKRWTDEGAYPPLSSEFDWYLVTAWLLAFCYLVLVFFHPRNSIGIFCLPLVLGLIAAALFWASPEPFPEAEGTRVWRWVHGGSLLVGTVAVMIGFAAGLMYLLAAYRLRHKLPPRQGLELPSLEWLGRVSERAIVVSVVFLLCGFGTGLVLSRLAHGAIWWTDPVVWMSTVLSAWMAVVAVFNFAYKPARQGRKVAYLTLGTFLFLAMTLGALLVGHQHGTEGPGTSVNPVKLDGDRP
jgi:ABC-type uncharacterized transport system permease subunit